MLASLLTWRLNVWLVGIYLGMTPAFLALTILSTATATEPLGPLQPTLLFELRGNDDGTTAARPIAILRTRHVEDARIAPAIDDSPELLQREKAAKDALAAAAFPIGARLTVLRAGRSVGSVTVNGDYSTSLGPGCEWLSIPTDLPRGVTVSPRDSVLAVNGGRFDTSWFRSGPPSDMERDALDAAARRLYRDQGVADALIEMMRRERAIAVRWGRSTLLVANFGILVPAQQALSEDSRHSLFVVLEWSRGKPELTHHRYTFGGGESYAMELPIDVIDVDGDGVPEIVTRRDGYEGWGYLIYRKQDGAWQSIFEGGGGGC